MFSALGCKAMHSCYICLFANVIVLHLFACFVVLATQSSCTQINSSFMNEVAWKKHNYSGVSSYSTAKHWSDDIENYVKRKKPTFPEAIFKELEFVSVNRGCGRMKNSLLTTENGTKFCARYRDNVEQIQGEVLTLILATILKIDNILPAYIMQVTPHSKTWSKVWQKLHAIGWRPQAVVVLTIWISDLKPVYFPAFLLKKSKCCVNANNLLVNNPNLEEASILMQLSDVFLLDYISGNVDRFVSHLNSLKWDSFALQRSVHNLKKTKEGFLFFLDNEYGFEHSYRLIGEYEHFHRELLNRFCLFRKSTADQIQKLSRLSPATLGDLLQSMLEAKTLAPFSSEKLLKTFHERLNTASSHIYSYCVL